MHDGRLMRGLFVLFAVSVLLSTPASAADKKPTAPGLTRTFTAKKPTKLGNAVAEFVIDLVHKNTAGVQDEYRKLTADTEEAAGGRYETHPFEGIQWFVVEVSWENTDKSSSENGEYIYLARQQLVAGIHRGYSVPTNVVAQVRVITSYSGGVTAAAMKGDEVASGTKITLQFEGFLDKVPLTAPGN